MPEAIAQGVPKKVFLKFPQNSQENTCTTVSFSIKCRLACNFIKKGTLVQVFSCEFCEIFKNIYFYRTRLAAASEYNVSHKWIEMYF